VKVGTIVTWINNDQADHSLMGAVADDQGNIVPAPDLFTSELLPSTTIKAGSNFSFNFDRAGEYLYICTIHKNMSGKIVVTE
jgi:plastocyanin